MDTLFSKVQSINGHTCAQEVITNGQFTRVYPMVSKASEHIARALHVARMGVLESKPSWGTPRTYQNGRISNFTIMFGIGTRRDRI
jgi:hypothetical protein